MTRRPSNTATYFESPAAFRRWLDANHETASELLVGFYKTHTGRPSLTWPESVDEALCVGWIDGIRRRVDDERYTIRFTPRRRGSIWSLVNIRRVSALTRQGRMRPAGKRAFEARRADRSGVYSSEQRDVALAPSDVKTFKANTKAWRFWQKQPPGYRRIATFYVTSAKRPETRARRLAALIADSESGFRIGLLRREPRKPS
jgi:uncharacterized protein YdeI (YjbR/CyaY-like superfamily)